MLWEDVCDDSSLQRFAAGASTNIEGNEEVTGTSAVLVEVEDEQITTDEDEDTTPPPATEVLCEPELLEASAMTFEENSGGGVTILSSVNSSNDRQDDAMAHPHVEETVPTFLPEELVAAAQPYRGSDSLMTEESVSLSLHPSSIDSSVMTEFTETSSLTASHAPSLDELSSIAESSVSSASELGSHVNETQDPLLEGSAEQQMQKEWYSRFRSDQEWRDFQASVKEVVEALANEDGDVPSEKRDELLAQLIANEEFFFWGEHQDPAEATIARAELQNSWIWTLLAAAGSAAVAGVALVRIIKGRA